LAESQFPLLKKQDERTYEKAHVDIISIFPVHCLLGSRSEILED